MRPSLRFIALAVVGWAGFRAATLGILPGASFFSIERSEAKSAPPIVATEFPPIDPVEPLTPAMQPIEAASAPPAIQYVPAFVGVPVTMRPGVAPVYRLPPAVPASSTRHAVPAGWNNVVPTPEPAFYAPVPPLDDWPLSRLASMSIAQSRSRIGHPGQSTPAFTENKIDRVQLTSWALLRGQKGAPLGPTSLANGGQLGGSQAGARLTYNYSRQIAASFRTSTDVGRRGGEVAAGVRVRPLVSLPIWLTAERRQRLGRYGGGRNAFAIFAEGGIYQRPMPWQFSLDAYLQGGLVGFHSRDAFVDGALTLTRPLFRQFSGGFGVWGGAQPGLYRVDAGPRVTMKVRDNIRVHFDYRQRLAGNAQPGSGPAVTLAADF